MTIVKCGFSVCSHNSATKPKEVGVCQKDIINLDYQEIVDVAHMEDYGMDYDGNVETFDALDCIDFDFNLEKAFK